MHNEQLAASAREAGSMFWPSLCTTGALDVWAWPFDFSPAFSFPFFFVFFGTGKDGAAKYAGDSRVLEEALALE